MLTKKELSRQLIKSKCEELFDKGNNICLEHATGTGKSLSAINLQARMNSQKTFICVAEIAHIQNWRDEYIKHGFEHLLESTEIFCYASLKNYANKSADLLILDEIHHAFSDTRIFLLTSLRIKRVIGLSATLEDEHKYLFNDIFKNMAIYTITMEEAIEMEILPKPVVNIMLLTLDNRNKSEIIEFKRGKNINEIHCDYLQRNAYIYAKNKYPTLNLIIHCTQQEKYNYLNGLYEQAKLSRRVGWLRHGGIRKKFLADCKTNKLKELCKTLQDDGKRFICFCGSIDQADILGGINAIHSKKDAKSVIAKFNSYEINSLFAMKMANEGLNLPGIEVGIIGQLDGVERPLIQKFGRSLRADFPKAYILVFRDTKDMDYLQNVINTIPETYISYI